MMLRPVDSIRFKLIVPFLAGMLLLTCILSLYTYGLMKSTVLDTAFTISRAKTDQVGTSMNLLFRSLLGNVRTIATDALTLAIFDTSSPFVNAVADAEKWLVILENGNDYLRGIYITDKEGRCVAASVPHFSGKNFVSTPAVEKAMSGVFTVENIIVYKATHQMNATMTGPINIDGVIVGAVVVLYTFPHILTYKESEAIFTALLAPSGFFSAHRNDFLMSNEAERFLDLYDQLKDVGKEGDKVEYSLRGRPYIGYAKIEPVSGWIILSSGLKFQVLDLAYRAGFTVFIISVTALALIAWIVARFTDGILFDLLTLIGYAKRVSEGAFDSRLEPTSRRDEVGILHASLNRLVDTLQSMILGVQNASRLKSEFLANMSHEIRTPINAVIGMAHLALREPHLSEKHRDYLEKIQGATRSLLGVINDILDISKIEAGKLELERVPFDIREVLDNVAAIHQINASSKSLLLTSECDPSVPLALEGDPLRLGQVLNNLLSNAVKFTQVGGVSLSCRLIEENEAGALVRIDVSDTGIGIGPESIKNLFKPFTQADTSITRKFGGTGLGLAISMSLVKLMGGDLSLISELGKGATFTLTAQFPVMDANKLENKADSPTEEDFKNLELEGKVVLIVEDNIINQTILHELIAPSKVTVLFANNGQEAVDSVQGNHVDLIFMDMQMPVMDGLQATMVIREFFNADSLPIIAVTANAMTEHKREGVSAGMNDYITKPVELNQLYETMQKWLCREKRER
ncbi:MAG: response regulator [Synergistaceae bacterium]|jgi:signal transduction histidine kinase/CheY-like chemotaxis protein|nr:response regulator [Synergistaceae bacterium]